ncbi:HlyD family type I secretion periplasmic adaptor subunit [Sphingomonas sp. FW199]|uniref:HlyD family type I secretion periplasmic adaptor subunit n=1 Tax=Sphingomonas sp. FW199 TaxID=3400217 RepID=UPI003CED556B
MYQLTTQLLPADQAVQFDDPQIALGRSLKIGLWLIGAFIVAMVAMAFFIQTTGAVIGAGKLSVESSVKQVAHPTGGVIAELFVREGDRVRKGQPIMRFDNTVSGGSANTLGQSVEQLLAAQARLTAERDGAGSISFPAALTTNPSPSAQAAMAEAQRQFSVRMQLRSAERASVRERINQAEQEIASISAQRASAERQTALIEPELEAVQSLYARKLVTITRLNQMERTAAELRGASASYASNMAQVRARIGELRQMAVEAEQNARNVAAQELANVQAQMGDQKIRSLAASDASERSLLRAPYNGVIDKLQFSTVGGVVPPTQTIMEVVPDNEPLIVEVSIDTADVDQLRMRQSAVVRLSAFNMQTTPELTGEVYYIAAERSTDERSGVAFYPVRIRISRQELARLGDLKLRPGMPVEAFVQTGRRSLLSYLTKPLLDQFNRAFREN